MRIKNIGLLVILAITVSFFISCSDEDIPTSVVDDEITFPDTGFYGTNILNEDSTVFNENNTYSFMADIPLNTYLNVVMENHSDSSGNWIMSASNGWNYSTDVENKKVKYISYGQIIADFRFGFSLSNGFGAATIKFYKNDETTPFRTKDITWQ